MRSGIKNLFLHTPILLIIVVALCQVRLAYFGELLTPAKGGGFGLFSTVDKLKNREFRVSLTHRGRQRAFPVSRFLSQSRSLQKAVQRATSLPSEGESEGR